MTDEHTTDKNEDENVADQERNSFPVVNQFLVRFLDSFSTLDHQFFGIFLGFLISKHVINFSEQVDKHSQEP
jgi:hypothetical protein